MSLVPGERVDLELSAAYKRYNGTLQLTNVRLIWSASHDRTISVSWALLAIARLRGSSDDSARVTLQVVLTSQEAHALVVLGGDAARDRLINRVAFLQKQVKEAGVRLPASKREPGMVAAELPALSPPRPLSESIREKVERVRAPTRVASSGSISSAPNEEFVVSSHSTTSTGIPLGARFVLLNYD